MVLSIESRRCFSSMIILTFAFIAISLQIEWRPLNGYGNNLQNPTWGMAPHSLLPHGYPLHFRDNISEPIEGPSVIDVMKKAFIRPALVSLKGSSLMQVLLGVTIQGDTATVDSANSRSEVIPIPAPLCDSDYDPRCLGNVTVPFYRCGKVNGTGTDPSNPRLRRTTRTSALDLENLYGITDAALNNKRTFLLGQLNRGANGAGNLPMWLLIDIFHREHNRKALELSTVNPDWNDERLFQEARKWVIAYYQKICSRDYTAAITGTPLSPNPGYNASVDPGVDLFWSVAYRFGHVAMEPYIPRLDGNMMWTADGPFLFEDAMMNPNLYKSDANDSESAATYLRGFMNTPETQIGNVNQITWAKPSSVLLGLPNVLPMQMVDIMRARECGVPTYNNLRGALGLTTYASFDDFAAANQVDNASLVALKLVYETIDRFDAYVGGLMENTSQGVVIGELFRIMVHNEFERKRAGDRFWFEHDGWFTKDELADIYGTTLTKLIKRNYPMPELDETRNAFFLESRQLNSTVRKETGFFPKFAGKEYPNSINPSYNYKLSWNSRLEDGEVDFLIQAQTLGWIGLGFDADNNTMKNGDIYLCRFVNGVVEVRDSYALDFGEPTLDVALGGTSDAKNIWGEQKNEVTSIGFTRKIVTGDRWDKDILNREMKVMFAFNIMTNELYYHGPTRSASLMINLLQRRETEWIKAGDGAGVTLIVLASIGIILTLCLMMFMLLKKTDAFVKGSSVFFSNIICLGAILVYISIYAWIGEPSQAKCNVRLWLGSLGISIIFAHLIAKNYRVAKIFGSKTLEFAKITDLQLLSFAGVEIGVLVVFLILWTSIDIFGPSTIINKANDNYFVVCSSDNIVPWIAVLLIIHGALLIVGALVAFMSRGAAKAWNESKWIGLATYNMAVIGILCVILCWALNSWPLAFSLILTLGLLVATSVTLALIFLPKVYYVVTGRSSNPSMMTRNSTASFSPSPSLGI